MNETMMMFLLEKKSSFFVPNQINTIHTKIVEDYIIVVTIRTLSSIMVVRKDFEKEEPDLVSCDSITK